MLLPRFHIVIMKLWGRVWFFVCLTLNEVGWHLISFWISRLMGFFIFYFFVKKKLVWMKLFYFLASKVDVFFFSKKKFGMEWCKRGVKTFKLWGSNTYWWSIVKKIRTKNMDQFITPMIFYLNNVENYTQI